MRPSRERALAGCAGCVAVSARALCCLPWLQGYAPPPAAEQSLLAERVASGSGGAAATTAPERPLLPSSAPRSDAPRGGLPPPPVAKEKPPPRIPPPQKPKPRHRRSASAVSLGDDDNYCPTCLEAYTGDNPRVTAACGHSFHLPCIYEWLERAPTCPVCGRKMEAEGLVGEG